MKQYHIPPDTESSSPVAGRSSLDLNAGQDQTQKQSQEEKKNERVKGRSTLDLPHTRGTAIFYPDGDAQITGAHYFPNGEGKKEKETEFEKQRRAAGRASARVHEMAKYWNLDHLWTITKRGGLESYEAAVKVVGKFKRLALREYPQFQAVFVPELHTGGGANDGTWHVHFAVHGFYDVKVLREVTYKIFGFDEDGKPRGQIDVSRAHVKGGSHKAVASYISAYISKNVFSESREKHQRYYFITRSCLIPSLRRGNKQNQSFGKGPVGRDYKGRMDEREARLIGWIFYKTGRLARVVWKSDDGLNFRIATFGGTKP